MPRLHCETNLKHFLLLVKYLTFLSCIRCTVAGWGKDAFGPTGQYQSIEREATVPLLEWADCQAKLQATRLGPQFQFNPTSFICAGGEEGYDACTVSHSDNISYNDHRPNTWFKFYYSDSYSYEHSCSTPASYLGSSGFKSQPRGILRFFTIFLSTSMKMLRYYLKLNRNNFFPYLFQFTSFINHPSI